LLEKGLTLIRSTRDFEYALTQWELKPSSRKTWREFKTHFHEAQLNLKKIRGPTMRQAGYHQANMVVEQIKEEIDSHLQARDSEVLAMLQSIPALTPASSSSSVESPIYDQQANALVDKTQLEILKLLKELTVELKQVKSSIPSSANQPTASTTGREPRRYKRTNVSKYCWSHGACAHDGKSCNQKRQGHKDEATFTNRMGGSSAYCS